MKLSKLSLVAVMTGALACSAFGADTLAEAFSNGTIKGELRTSFFSKNDTDTAQKGENIYNFGFELGYVTDPFYGFRLGLTAQGNATPGVKKDAKLMWDKEQWGDGVVLSEAYLGYGFAKTDIKVGRQYISTPVVAGNPTRAFIEAFEGVSVTSKDISDTTLYANYFWKFQGRTSRVDLPGNTAESSKAPGFSNRVILAGTGPWAHEFDNIYSLGFSNKSIANLTLSAQIGFVDGVDFITNARTGVTTPKKTDVSLYYAEANYVLPLDALKLKFDMQYRGSRVSNEPTTVKYDGDMLGFRVGFAEFNGLSGSVAYTTVSNSDALIVGVGNGPATYTMLPIRGPYVFTSHAGMDLFKYQLDYDFSKIGAKGLKGSVSYVNGEQSGQSNNYDVNGYSVGLNYAVPALKGLSTSLTYTELEKEYEKNRAANVNYSDLKERKEKEVWLKVSYKFSNK